MRYAIYLAYGIIQGIITWEDVKENWKPIVKKVLDAYGIDTNGQPIEK